MSLEFLTQYNKNLSKINQIENQLKGKASNLDNYIDLDGKLNALEEKKQANTLSY